MSDINVYEIDLLSSLDWQRSNASIVKKLAVNDHDWLNTNNRDFWTDWQRDVFTLATANDFGLAVWSIILDEGIYGFSGESPVDYPAFGFSVDDENFFDGSFAADSGYSYEFTTEQKRILLQLKAFQVLSMSGSVVQINKAMMNIFGNDVILCFDMLDMSFIYQLNDNSMVNFINEIRNRDLLPRPIGIGIDSVRTLNSDTFGFSVDDQNFFDGNFYNGEV